MLCDITNTYSMEKQKQMKRLSGIEADSRAGFKYGSDHDSAVTSQSGDGMAEGSWSSNQQAGEQSTEEKESDGISNQSSVWKETISSQWSRACDDVLASSEQVVLKGLQIIRQFLSTESLDEKDDKAERFGCEYATALVKHRMPLVDRMVDIVRNVKIRSSPIVFGTAQQPGISEESCFECLWILSNVASTDLALDLAKKSIHMFAVSLLTNRETLQLTDRIVEQLIWFLCNITGQRMEIRDHIVRQMGFIQMFQQLLQQPKNLAIQQRCVSLTSRLYFLNL